VTEAIRRQICLVDVHAGDLGSGVDPSELTMIVGVSDLYFHLEGQGGGRFLEGLSTPEEAPGFDFGYDGQEYFAEFVWPRLAHRSSSFERCGHVRGWSGLYAVTPGRSGIAGCMPGIANLFEVHSLPGAASCSPLGSPACSARES